MLNIKKVLFPTDFSRCADQAYPYALRMVRQHGAELHVFHCRVPFEGDGESALSSAGELQELVQRLTAGENDAADRSARQSVPTVFREERAISAAQSILEYAGENDIDLIVMGTHGRRGMKHLLLGSVAEEVVRYARIPVLTVRESKVPKVGSSIQRILVPMDFSDYAQHALAYAKELAALYEAELQLLHVVQEVMHPAFYVTGRTSIFEFTPEVEKTSVENMRSMLGRVGGPNVSAEIYLKEGHPAQQIAQFAQEYRSDLIVIATHGVTGVQHFLVGSVAEKVVRTSPVPVFVVKSFGKSLIA
jgi:nucleotide-binding universal stress UspA family protein